MTKRIVCIYHGSCADGFTAAWAVYQALGYRVEFVPGTYGAPPPDVSGADVIMVDFSYKRPVLDVMAAQARSILILDHHKTAEADLAGFGVDMSGWAPPFGWDRHQLNIHQDQCEGIPHKSQYVLFDMGRSGAQLAWDFFHIGRFGLGQARPVLVDYVADRDLWRFKLPHSREIAAWVFSHDYAFPAWDEMERKLNSGEGFAYARAQGEAIERKHFKDVAELVRATRREMVIGGHRVPVANLPYTMASDAAGSMAEGQPFAACYIDRADLRVFSLRSREGGLDVAEIAASYGGGGHRSAAGFQMPIGWEGDA